MLILKNIHLASLRFWRWVWNSSAGRRSGCSFPRIFFWIVPFLDTSAKMLLSILVYTVFNLRGVLVSRRLSAALWFVLIFTVNKAPLSSLLCLLLHLWSSGFLSLALSRSHSLSSSLSHTARNGVAPFVFVYNFESKNISTQALKWACFYLFFNIPAAYTIIPSKENS